MSGRAALVALLSLLCGITCLHGQKCDPTTCTCKDARGTVEVNLTNVDNVLRKQNGYIIDDNSTDYTVYSSLCQPLVCGDSNDSLVCVTLHSDNANVSYGDVVSMTLLSTTEEDVEHCVVLEMIGGTDAESHVRRRSRIHLNCQKVFHDELLVLFNSTRDISEVSLNMTLNTSLSCVQRIGPNAMSTVSSTPSAESFSSSILMPLVTLSSSTHTSTTPTFTTPTSTTPTSTTPTSTTPTSTTPTSTTPTSTTPTSTTPTSSIPTSTTPTFTTPTSTTPMSTTPTSTTPTFTTPTTPMPPTPSSPPPSPSLPSSPPPSPSLPSSSSLPSCPPQSCPACEGCTEKLALSLGLSIPGTALLTILLMILICACFQKSKKKGVYIRMAPTVYFDEDDRD